MAENTASIAELKTFLQQAQADLDEALADGHAVPIARARKVAEAAKQAVDDAIAVQRVLAKREEAAKLDRIAADKAAQRACRAKLCAVRGEAADRAVDLINRLGAEVAQMNDCNREILLTLPGGFDADRAAMTAFSERLRTQIWRAHVLTGSRWSDWELEQMPDFRQQINEGNSYLGNL